MALDNYLTVGELLKFIEKHNIPMDAPVLMQRVEDSYYEPGNGWLENSWFMDGDFIRQRRRSNMEMMIELWKRNSGDEPEFEMEDPKAYMLTEEELKEYREQYTQAWCPVFYKEKPNALFLDAHY